MNFTYCRQTVSNRGPHYPSHFTAPHCSEKKTIPTDKDTPANQLKFRPIPPNDRATKDWTAIAWPINIKSRTPDGKFGPATQMPGWGDCWFLAPLAAVANAGNGHKILAQSIKKVCAEGIDGYRVAFAGSPDNPVFISNQTLNNCLDENDGDADTRLLELAARRFFSVNGRFKFLYLTTFLKRGMKQAEAEECFRQWCDENNDIQDPMTFNPMLGGGEDYLALFLFTGVFPECLHATRTVSLEEEQIIGYLNRYATNDRHSVSMVMNSEENPLGHTQYAVDLVQDWDVIRTDITRDGRFRKQERAFLNALEKWLETPDDNTWQTLRTAAGRLPLQHIRPVSFVNLLELDQIALRQNHRDKLRSAVRQVLNYRPGYIGFAGHHTGTIEGINAAADTFTYYEPNYPTVVHTGVLSDLVQEIKSGNVWLSTLEPTTGRDDRKRFEHAGTSRGRRLKQICNQVVRDGKIDQTESRPLADLMEMDDGAFRQVYDSDKNGVIEGDELKAVQLRVERWVHHFKLTPIW